MQLIKIKPSKLYNFSTGQIFEIRVLRFNMTLGDKIMKKIFTGFTLFFLGIGFVLADEYPTQDTVRYALNCMSELGGQTDENLYTCACRYDGIRSKMPFSDYEEGVTFERNMKMPGEKGSSFRDNERAKRFYKKLLAVREVANSNCIVVKHVKMIKPTNRE
jgi:hypothetical protein